MSKENGIVEGAVALIFNDSQLAKMKKTIPDMPLP